MAKHHRRYRHHRRNPLGIHGGTIKDLAYNLAGAAGSSWLAGLVGQSGWLDVAATIAAAIGVSFAGKFVGGAPASEELLKGGLIVAAIKGAGQVGVSIPGLGMYVPNYFSAPTASDAYGRATAPMIALPAAAAAGPGGPPVHKGMGYGPGGRFRSRFITRF